MSILFHKILLGLAGLVMAAVYYFGAKANKDDMDKQ